MAVTNISLDPPLTYGPRTGTGDPFWRRWFRLLRAPLSRSRLFVVVGVVVAITDGVFVVMNYQFDRQTLEQTWRANWERTFAAYELTVGEQLDKMVMLADFVAGDEEVQWLFHAGRTAVEREGGGPGRAGAHHARVRLYERLAPAWQRLSTEYGIRQLHFHLGPGSLSFLRVHQPDRYGDRMDDLRHIIVDANADQMPRQGFEIGRIYSGLRGVVPVTYAPDGGAGQFTGVLEVGTSFDVLVERLDTVFDAGVAVLLDGQAVDTAMWREFIARRFPDQPSPCDCRVEAYSRDQIFDLIGSGAVLPTPQPQGDYAVARLGDRDYLILQKPLRDYRGTQDTSRAAVGRIVVWRDVTAQVAAFRTDQWLNALYALLALVVIELCLFFAIRFVLQAKQATEKSSRAKSCFLATMSHELRTPLNAVIGFSDMLAQEAAGSVTPRQREYLGDIQTAGSKLLSVVDDVLEYADLQEGAYVPVLEPVDAGRRFDDVVAALRPMAERRGVELSAASAGSVEIKGEPRTLGQALDRLLTHAVTGTTAGRTVTAALTTGPREIVVTVHDGAPSLSASDIDMLLHPLDHAGDAYRGGLGENGLRLALVKAFVEAHGGTLDIEPGDTVGNTIRLSLPARRTHGR